MAFSFFSSAVLFFRFFFLLQKKRMGGEPVPSRMPPRLRLPSKAAQATAQQQQVGKTHGTKKKSSNVVAGGGAPLTLSSELERDAHSRSGTLVRPLAVLFVAFSSTQTRQNFRGSVFRLKRRRKIHEKTAHGGRQLCFFFFGREEAFWSTGAKRRRQAKFANLSRPHRLHS